jgi:acetoin utilization deacetylase AcuC-like enzyme
VDVVYSPAHLGHNPLEEIADSRAHSPHEHTGRAEAIRAALAADSACAVREPVGHGTGPIEAVHDPGLLAFLERAWERYQVEVRPSREVVPDFFYRTTMRGAMGEPKAPTAISAELGWWCFETTTPITKGTYAAARGAVDAALTAADLVLGGAPHAYALCRPPGHHAARALYGGYCFFNNAAIAAQHAASRGARVTVLDVDYHHGNGTQEIFYERADVQFVSLHADPVRAYPFLTGHADETGAGAGAGTTLNIPLAARVDDAAYAVWLARALDAIRAFAPDVLVVSLGVDTFDGDPICDLALTRDGFARSGEMVGALGLPTVVVQEGGYALDELGANVRAWLTGLASA